MKSRNRLLSTALALIVLFAVAAPMALAGQPSPADDIKDLYSGANAFANLLALTDIGPRVAGGPNEKAAAAWIATQMASYGLQVEVQEFPINYYEELSPPELQMISPIAKVYQTGVDFATMTYSGAGDVTANIYMVDPLIPSPGGSTSGCEAADFAGFPAGSIAVIQRGTCNYVVKALNAEAAGAVGVLIYNEGNPGRTGLVLGTLLGPGVTIPVVGTTYALGLELYGLAPGGVTMRLKVDTVGYPSTSQNVIGTLEGTQPDQGIVYLGGHYDSVSGVLGANDDASGTATMLEAARVLGTTGHRTKATLKFIAFGAEETGLNGSYAYVAANLAEVSTKGLGMVNLDMEGVGTDLMIGNIGWGGYAFRDYAGDKATAMGRTWSFFTAGTNSDHTYFEQAGVPAAFLTERPDLYYHTPADTPDKINAVILEQNGELATASMYDWAKNPVLRAKQAAKLEKVHVYHDQVLEIK